MVYRKDYIENRLARVVKNLETIRKILETEPSNLDLLNNLTRLQAEYLELIEAKNKLESGALAESLTVSSQKPSTPIGSIEKEKSIPKKARKKKSENTNVVQLSIFGEKVIGKS